MGNPVSNTLKTRNFRLFWLGQGTSLLGDQFYMIAMPWLVLMMTGDALSLGIVLALTGIPRAVFMLAGGAMTDRFSQRSVMMASDVLRLGLTAALAAMIYYGQINIWWIYAFSLAFGVISGFFMPASSSIVPELVKKEELQAGNAITQGTAQMSVFIGPFIAGAIIAMFASRPSAGQLYGTYGISIALAIDAVTFLVSVITLWMMKMPPAEKTPGAVTGGSMIESIRSGIGYVWKNPMLRNLFLIMAAMNFLFSGPVLVGIPVIASQRLSEGAAAFGIIMAGFGGGNLLGIIAAGALPKPKPRHMGYIFIGVIGLFGLGEMVIGQSNTTAMAFAILLSLGLFNGYISIIGITLLQRNTPQDMMGRLMSLLMFSSVGLIPLSQALSGALIKVSIDGLFVGAGILMVIVAIMAALSPAIKNIGLAN